MKYHRQPRRGCRPAFPPSQTEAGLLAGLRARLLAAVDRYALARELGVTPLKLAAVLRGRWPIDDDLAARLGYRRITRFEKIAPAVPHAGQAQNLGPAAVAKPIERTS